MFRDVTFGQYYPVDSFVHRMDARAKLILAVLYLVGIFFINSFVGFAWLTIFLLTAIFVSKVPLKSVIKSINLKKDQKRQK